VVAHADHRGLAGEVHRILASGCLLLTSTALTVFVLPALYRIFTRAD